MYVVRCRNAAGTCVDVRVRATSERKATRAAEHEIRRETGDHTYRAQWCLS